MFLNINQFYERGILPKNMLDDIPKIICEAEKNAKEKVKKEKTEDLDEVKELIEKFSELLEKIEKM